MPPRHWEVMSWKAWVSIALALALAAVPAAVATTESGSVSTGDVDTYGGGFVCPQIFTKWTVELQLEDPSAVDTVALTAEGPFPDADVATGQDSTATVTTRQSHGCAPFIQVTGVLVDGSVDYTISYDYEPLGPFEPDPSLPDELAIRIEH